MSTKFNNQTQMIQSNFELERQSLGNSDKWQVGSYPLGNETVQTLEYQCVFLQYVNNFWSGECHVASVGGYTIKETLALLRDSLKEEIDALELQLSVIQEALRVNYRLWDC